MPWTPGVRLVVLAALCGVALRAQALNQAVLLVHNSNDADSAWVASYYAAKRAIPAANRCAVSFPDKVSVAQAEWPAVKSAIRGCLNAVGRTRVLYIVMAYNTPFRLMNSGESDFNALDQYVADIWDRTGAGTYSALPPAEAHPYFADNQNQGNAFVAFTSLAAWRAGSRAPVIYSVFRVDGPTPALAMGLVDKAMAAEAAGGPVGQACFDRIVDNVITFLPDVGTRGGDWSLYRAGEFVKRAGIPATEDLNTQEFGTPPSGLCPGAILYSGWYSLNHYNDAFSWNQGAVGFHLDSLSAESPRSGANWSANAILKGITVTAGAITEPYLEGLPRPSGIFRNLLEGATVGDAFLRNTRWLRWVILNIGDPLYRPFAGGRYPFNPPPPENSFRVSSQYTVGGKAVTGTITLAAPAPSSGAVFALSSSDPTVTSVPSSLTIRGGATTGSFTISANAVTGPRAPVLTATWGAVRLQNAVEVDPVLADLAATPPVSRGGQNVTFKVLLNTTAPKKGIAVALSSGNPAIVLPPSLTVPAGQSSAEVTVMAGPVSAITTGPVSASYAGATVALSYTVNP